MINLLTILKALANEHRLRIFHWLKEPEKHFTTSHSNISKDGVCVGLIETKIGLSQSTVSTYLNTLQKAGLVIAERKGQWTFYKRNDEAIKELSQQIKNL